MRSSIADFCLASPKLFLIPAEHLSASGIDAPFADVLFEERGVSRAWLQRFSEAFALYFERVSDLAVGAPAYWRPPRCANVCIVQDAIGTRPYYLPFAQASWLLYESDFDPTHSTLEFGAYQLAHVERLSSTGDPGVAWIHNLGYFLERSEAERVAFAKGCEASTRPDAPAFVSLGALMKEVSTCSHDQLGPRPPSTERTARIGFAGLNVPEGQQASFQAIAKSFLAESHNATYRYYEAQRVAEEGDASEPLLRWLAEAVPRVLVTDQAGGVLWDYERPNALDGLRDVLGGIAPGVATSLRQDWALIDQHSCAFVSALVEDDALVFPEGDLDQEDGIYIHPDRRAIVYSMVQPGLRTLAEEAPPYHRMLVGARTVHEWSHLAVEAGIVRVPESRANEHADQQRRLIEMFDEIVSAAPTPLRSTAAEEVALLARDGCHLGELPLQRVGDYQANLLAREFLSPAETEAYVRANVRPLIDEPNVGPYLALARYAYEYQYLRLIELADPFAYFVATTWFGHSHVESGVVSLSEAKALFDVVSSLFDCHEVDEARIRVPGRG
ncbi:MAG: hypothetical protein AAF436_18400 [Myxococcota bacterium]